MTATQAEQRLAQLLVTSIEGHLPSDALPALTRAMASVIASGAPDVGRAEQMIDVVADDLSTIVQAIFPLVKAAQTATPTVGRA